jgi:hypothetical protein
VVVVAVDHPQPSAVHQPHRQLADQVVVVVTVGPCLSVWVRLGLQVRDSQAVMLRGQRTAVVLVVVVVVLVVQVATVRSAGLLLLLVVSV